MDKKIVIFSAFYEPHFGGVERYVKELSSQLVKQNFQIIIITSDTHNIGFENIENGIKIFRLKHKFFIKGRLPVPYSLKEVNAVKKVIEQFQPDLIITNMRVYPLSLLAARISSKYKFPSILIDHVSGRFDFSSKFISFLSHTYENFFTLYLKKNIDYFYGVSEKVNEWLHNFNINPAGVLYNGVNKSPEKNDSINTANEYSIDPQKFIVFFAGRLLPEKGILELINAYKLFAKKDSQLVICGDGPLFQQIKKNNNDKNIIITGQISHQKVMSLLDLSKVVVIPSYYPEGLPTLILEAGVSNCAVITTDSGGAAEVITNQESGLIIEKKSVESIHNSLQFLYDEPKVLNKFSENLKNKILNNFTWETIADKLIKFVDNLNNNHNM